MSAPRRLSGGERAQDSSGGVQRGLIALSRELGREDRRLVILGEGNCSAAIGDGTFWIKASGGQLRTLTAAGVCRVRVDSIGGLLESGAEDDTCQDLQRALVDPRQPPPSVETFLHAVCLTEGDARWVAHTHPVSVNSILCSRLGAEPFLQPIFPDAIVVCGRLPGVVPYTDPGISLARRTADVLRAFRQQHGQPPRMLLIINHGLVALGQTATDALNITLMADKWAQILLGTFRLGGPQPLLESDAERIDQRLDEAYRRERLRGLKI